MLMQSYVTLADYWRQSSWAPLKQVERLLMATVRHYPCHESLHRLALYYDCLADTSIEQGGDAPRAIDHANVSAPSSNRLGSVILLSVAEGEPAWQGRPLLHARPPAGQRAHTARPAAHHHHPHRRDARSARKDTAAARSALCTCPEGLF